MKFRDDGLFEILWSTEGPIDPVPWNQICARILRAFACDWSDPAKGEKLRDLGSPSGLGIRISQVLSFELSGQFKTQN